MKNDQVTHIRREKTKDIEGTKSVVSEREWRVGVESVSSWERCFYGKEIGNIGNW